MLNYQYRILLMRNGAIQGVAELLDPKLYELLCHVGFVTQRSLQHSLIPTTLHAHFPLPQNVD